MKAFSPRPLVVALPLLAAVALPVDSALAADGALDVSFRGTGAVVLESASADLYGSDVAAAPDGRAVVIGSRYVSDPGGAESELAWWAFSSNAAAQPFVCAFFPPFTDYGALRAGTFDHAGRLVVAGEAYYGSSGYIVLVARFLYPDCQLDSAFDGGIVAIDLPGHTHASDLAVDSAGNVVVVGRHDGGSAGLEGFVARILADGSFASTFDGDGIRTLAYYTGSDSDDRFEGVALAEQGKIWVVGSTQTPNDHTDMTVFKLSADGSLDTSFASNGKRRVAFDLGSGSSQRDDHGAAIIDERESDRVVIAGRAEYDGPGGVTVAVAARLLPDGTLDVGFASGGKYVAPFTEGGRNFSRFGDLARQSDGRYLLVGDRNDGFGDGIFQVRRLLASGSPDPSFGSGGVASASFAGGDRAAPVGEGVALDAGRALVGGWVVAGTNDLAVARFGSALIFSDGFEAGDVGGWPLVPWP